MSRRTQHCRPCARARACDKARQRRTSRPALCRLESLRVCLCVGTGRTGLSWCLQTSDKDMSFMSECLGAGLPHTNRYYLSRIATSAVACATVLACPYPPAAVPLLPVQPSHRPRVARVPMVGRYAPPCFALPCLALPCLALPTHAPPRDRRRHSAATAEELLARGQQEDGDHRRRRRCVRITAAAKPRVAPLATIAAAQAV